MKTEKFECGCEVVLQTTNEPLNLIRINNLKVCKKHKDQFHKQMVRLKTDFYYMLRDDEKFA